jgi:hypothetical protein
VEKTAKAVETAVAAETVPVPIERRTALKGGAVTIEFVRVEVADAQSVVALPKTAEPEQVEVQEAAYVPAERRVETAAFEAFDVLAAETDGEKIPLPISRRTALKGGDVTLRFVSVEAAKSSPSMFPAAARGLAMRAEKAGSQVLLANYVKVTEKTQQLGMAPPANSGSPRDVSTAALDDPGPELSATRFTRADLPVFLLKKIDGEAEPLP